MHIVENGQISFKNPAVFTPQDFKNTFSHFLILRMRRLNKVILSPLREFRLKLTIKTPERHHYRRSGDFIINFE